MRENDYKSAHSPRPLYKEIHILRLYLLRFFGKPMYLFVPHGKMFKETIRQEY